MNMTHWSSDRTLTQSEHASLTSEIISTLRASNIQCEAPRTFIQDNHTSIRLVFCTEEDVIQAITTRLGILEFGHESSLIVFKYQGVKVELHGIKDTEYDFALRYLSFDNAGSIPGKILHQMGMKLSIRGLFYLIRENMFDGESQSGHIMEEVLLTTRWEEALGLLSIKDADWQAMTSKEELFELIGGCREFCPSIFLEFLQAKTEVFENSSRDDIFLAFCKWLENQAYPHRGYRPRRIYRKALFDLYAILKNRMFANSGKFLRRRDVNKRLHVDNVKAWLGLDNSDPRLANVIRFFKQRHDELEILSMTTAEIRTFLLTYLHHAPSQPSNG